MSIMLCLKIRKSYERGLDDLKLSFEALLDEYKHKVEKMPIGSLLKEVDNRNMNGSIKNVQGINITNAIYAVCCKYKWCRSFKIQSGK